MRITFGSLLAAVLAYVVLGASGLALAIPPGYASPIFPAAGLAVALALCFGNRILSGIWFGSLIINLIVAWQHGRLDGASIIVAGALASGAALQTWAARWMILRWVGDNWRLLQSEKDIILFLVAGAPFACLVSATFGNGTLYFAGLVTAEDFFYSWCNWWTGDTLGILIFTPLALIFLFRRDSPWRGRRIIALPMLATLCLVVVAFLGVSNRDKKQQIAQIEDHGQRMAQSLAHRLVAHQEALSALKRLIEVMPGMTFQQFEYFTQITLQDNKDIFALSFNPIILESSRSVFEQSMAKSSMASFRITERNGLQQLVPAPERPIYVPVGFIAPLEGNLPAIGFNIHSEPIRRDAIERAFISKGPTVTAPIQLVQDEQKRIGVLALTPAYRKGDASVGDGVGQLIGFAVGVFKIDEMVQIAIRDLAPTGIIFRITDQLADTERSLLFQSDEGQDRPIEPYVWRTQLTMADRQWNLEVFPTEGYLHQHRSAYAWAVGVLGSLFATLLQVMLLAMTGRTSVIQQKVNEQTIQLIQSFAEAKKRELFISEKNEELELVIKGAQLGTWNWNILSGQVAFNERFCTMLGYQPDELKPHVDTWKELLHPDDEAHVYLALEAHLEGKTPSYSTEHRLRHKSGQWIWVHDAGRVMQRNPNGNPFRAFGIHLDITERKESIRLLAKAKEESDFIIRNFLDTLIVVNTSLIVIRINQATCDLLGFEEEELIGQRVFTLFHDAEDHVQSVFAFYANHADLQLEDRQGLRNVELCYRHKNGDRLPMSFNISTLRDDEGAVTGVVAGAKDVSRLSLALDKIALQKEYIETLFDIAPQGLLAISPSQEIVKQNLAFKQILHICSERLTMTSDECARNIIEQIVKNPAKGENFIFHFKKDDIIVSFRCSSTGISILEDVASVASIEDITDERNAEAEKKLLATVIEQIGDSVVISGIDEVVQYVNPAMLRNSGFSEDELLGSTPHIFRTGLLEVSVIEELRSTLANGRIWHGHYKSRRKDNSIIEEDVTISPVRNEEGALTHYVAIKRDVTEMINLQQQLLRAQKMEAIGQLAAGIAHEINTPMQYVLNNATFLGKAFSELQSLLVEVSKAERSLFSSEISTLLETVNLDFLLQEIPESINDTHDGINRVVGIVSAMKAFSHPGSDERVVADLNFAIENTIIVCRNEWKYAADMVTDFDPDLPLVPCFPDQLNQVVLNLIINASHAIQARNLKEDKGVAGRISIVTRSAGAWVEIQISDNGCGIPEEIQQRIFDPFFTTKEVGRGTGQGLAIAYDIVVNKHGGQLEFSSSLGMGTTFIIRLPIATPQEF